MSIVHQMLKSEGFPSNEFTAVARCAAPKCAICEMAKGNYQATKGTTQTPNVTRELR